jgi:hypothetical protein
MTENYKLPTKSHLLNQIADLTELADAQASEIKRLRDALDKICAVYEINGGKWRFDEKLYEIALNALEGGEEWQKRS